MVYPASYHELAALATIDPMSVPQFGNPEVYELESLAQDPRNTFLLLTGGWRLTGHRKDLIGWLAGWLIGWLVTLIQVPSGALFPFLF